MSTLKIKNNQGAWDYIQLAGPDAFQDAVKYYTATGPANAYAITTSPTFSSLTEGYGVAIKIPVDSTAASTLNINSIGAKPIKKANGADITNLKAGGVYTLRYDGTNFILQGEGASGNATASDLLSGKTATTDAGEIVGTMTNRGAVNQSLAINGTYTIPAGYHNGSGVVSQSITTKGAQTFTPGTANQTIAAGQYLSGAQTILGDADLVPGNIKSGVNIFGVAGSLVEGARYYTASFTIGTTLTNWNYISGSYGQAYTAECSYPDLGWVPRVVIIRITHGGGYSGYVAYSDGNAFFPSNSQQIYFNQNGAFVSSTGFKVVGSGRGASATCHLFG